MKISSRPLIPLTFALLCQLSAAYAFLGLWKTERVDETLRFGTLEPHRALVEPVTMNLEPVTLNPERMYTLEIAYPFTYPAFGQLAFNATLVNAEGNAIFALEDAYWRETGTWSEGGESGSWDEQNSDSEFNFRVAEAGSYLPSITVYEAIDLPKIALRARVLQSNPRAVGPAPFVLGMLVFLAIAGVVAYRRTSVTRKLLETLGPGSKLRLRDELFTVVDVREHAESGEVPGIEFRLQNHLGEERFVAVETYEKLRVDSEDNEYTRNSRYMMLELPISADERAMLARQKEQREIEIRGETLGFDANNSGIATLTTTFEGESYQSRYDARVFLPARFPTEHSKGALILEHVTYEERPEDEWSLMQILTWHDIEILDVQPRT